MSISFSSSGSTQGNPKKGLLGNIKGILNTTAKTTIPLYSVASNILHSIPKAVNGTYTPTSGGFDYATPAAAAQGGDSIIAEQNKKNAAIVTKPKTTGVISSSPNSRSSTGTIPGVYNPSENIPVQPTTPTPPPPIANSTSPTIDPASAARAVYKAGDQTDLEKYYIDKVMSAKKMQNAGSLGQYAEAGMYAGQSPEQLYDSLISSPDLAGRADASKGLYDTFGNIYGDAATQGLTAANTIAGRGLTGATSVLGASLPEQLPPTGASLYNPLNANTGLGTDASTGLVKGSAAQQVPVLQNELSTLHTAQQNIASNESLFTQFLNKVNPTDVTPLNQIINRASSIFSSSDYANFNALIPTLRAQYAQIIGASRGLAPTDAYQVATSEIPDSASVGTIKSVLNTMKQEAQNTINAKDQQYQNTLQTFNTGNYSAPQSESTSAGGYNFKLVNGQWVPA